MDYQDIHDENGEDVPDPADDALRYIQHTTASQITATTAAAEPFRRDVPTGSTLFTVVAPAHNEEESRTLVPFLDEERPPLATLFPEKDLGQTFSSLDERAKQLINPSANDLSRPTTPFSDATTGIHRSEEAAIDLALDASKAIRKVELELEAQEADELERAIAESKELKEAGFEEQGKAELARALAESRQLNEETVNAQEEAELARAFKESRAATEAEENADLAKALMESRASNELAAAAKEQADLAKALSESRSEWEAGALSDADVDNLFVAIDQRAHTSKVEEAELMRAIEASYRSLSVIEEYQNVLGAPGPSGARVTDDSGVKGLSSLSIKENCDCGVELRKAALGKFHDASMGKEGGLPHVSRDNGKQTYSGGGVWLAGDEDTLQSGVIQPELPPCPPPTKKQIPEEDIHKIDSRPPAAHGQLITGAVSSEGLVDNGRTNNGDPTPIASYFHNLTGVLSEIYESTTAENPGADLTLELAMNAIAEEAEMEPASEKRKGKMKADPCNRCEERAEAGLKVCGHRFCMKCIMEGRDRAEKEQKWASDGTGMIPCWVCGKGYPGRAIGSAVIRLSGVDF